MNLGRVAAVQRLDVIDQRQLLLVHGVFSSEMLAFNHDLCWKQQLSFSHSIPFRIPFSFMVKPADLRL